MACIRRVGVAVVFICTVMAAAAADQLTIGSRAPRIDIEHWVSDRNPVSEFEPGKVYVIEFWATWCGPCIASIPHLRELQRRHAADVTVISVSDESRDVVEEFLKREHGDETFASITGAYWLATDPDGSVKRDYMRAADQHGIPTAFIVGKTGEIEWIGHPMRIDEPVARVAAGTWDRAAYATRMKEEQEIGKRMRVVSQKVRQKQFAEALEIVDSILANAPSAEMRVSLENSRRRIEEESKADAARPPAVEAPLQPGTVDIRRLAIGDHVTIPVTGLAGGPVWGDFLYTTDSSVGAAAVHAGVVRVGETKPIKVWIVPSPGSFAESTRNGIQSRRWGQYRAAFIMQAVDAAAVPIGINRAAVHGPGLLGKTPGEIVEMTVKGRKNGPVWGTDVYTADSDVATAAVHAGILKDGEEAAILVVVVASPESHAGAVRNGVRSQAWGPYPKSFVIQRKTTPARPKVAAAPAARQPRSVQSLAVGEAMTLTITGMDKGYVWGTDQYTGDSRFEVAAVHAGVLRAGEEGEVVVTRVPALTRYEGSMRNGVRSQSWGPYSTAYRVEKKPDAARE